MFEEILSPEGVDLYERLLAGERITTERDAHNPDVPGSPGHELVDVGLASVAVQDGVSLFPVEPTTAQASMLNRLLADLTAQHRRLVSFVEGVTETNWRSPATSADTEVLTDMNRITHLSFEMFHMAARNVSSFVTAHFAVRDRISTAMPRIDNPASPMIRTIYTSDSVGLIHRAIDESVASGEQARVVDYLPHKMIIVDDSRALVAMDRTGLGAALLTSSPQLVDGLRMLFESAWERGMPYLASSKEEDLTPQEQRVVSLLGTGIKDELIAKQLNVTVRTVRRHIAAAMNKLGAENRFAAGVLATRRGWI